MRRSVVIRNRGFSSSGVPGTPNLTAWANSGKSGRATREQALRLMGIRQARLEPLAWSASGRERMVSGPTAASGGENGLDFPQESPGSVHNKVGSPLGQIRPIRSFAIRRSVSGSSQRGRVCARPEPAGPGVELGTGEWWSVASGQ